MIGPHPPGWDHEQPYPPREPKDIHHMDRFTKFLIYCLFAVAAFALLSIVVCP